MIRIDIGPEMTADFKSSCAEQFMLEAGKIIQIQNGLGWMGP